MKKKIERTISDKKLKELNSPNISSIKELFKNEQSFTIAVYFKSLESKGLFYSDLAIIFLLSDIFENIVDYTCYIGVLKKYIMSDINRLNICFKNNPETRLSCESLFYIESIRTFLNEL